MRKTLTLAAAAVLLQGAKSSPKPKTVEQQIRDFRFVADFTPKEPEREISTELFWRYPLELPKV